MYFIKLSENELALTDLPDLDNGPGRIISSFLSADCKSKHNLIALWM